MVDQNHASNSTLNLFLSGSHPRCYVFHQHNEILGIQGQRKWAKDLTKLVWYVHFRSIEFRSVLIVTDICGQSCRMSRYLSFILQNISKCATGRIFPMIPVHVIQAMLSLSLSQLQMHVPVSRFTGGAELQNNIY